MPDPRGEGDMTSSDAENRVVDLMDALETSVADAKKARVKRQNDQVRVDRLDHLIEDLTAISEDLDEFFPGEFDGSGSMIARVIDTLKDALMEPADD